MAVLRTFSLWSGVFLWSYLMFVFSVIDFNEFLDLVIQHQGDAKDVYDEIMQGFKLLDVGESFVFSEKPFQG